MVQIVTSYGGVNVGDVASLKSGSPDFTVIGFEGPEPVTPVFAPGATPSFAVAQVEAAPVARVMWVTADGADHVQRLPIEALKLKAAPAPAAKASP